MNFKGYSLKGALGALAFGTALLLGTGEWAYAQDHHQRHEWRDLREHQRAERYYYGDSYALREHQRREQRELEHHQYHERHGYYNDGYYNNGRYNRGYYDNGWGWGWNRPYYRRRSW